MRGNVRGTEFSQFSRTTWASAKVESANYCGTLGTIICNDYKMADSTCSAHVNVAKHDYDRTKGATGFVLVQIKLRLKCFCSS